MQDLFGSSLSPLAKVARALTLFCGFGFFTFFVLVLGLPEAESCAARDDCVPMPKYFCAALLGGIVLFEGYRSLFRPIRDMVDNSHFCEIFLSDVEVPVENLVGVEGGAFKQTMVQLEHERGGIDRLLSNRPLYDLAVSKADRDDPRIRQQVARLEADYHVGRLLVYREVLKQAPRGFSAATKVFCTEHQVRVAHFAASVLGPEMTLDHQQSRELCYSPSYLLAGGTSEIMRNILGERVLGLPREPRV